MLRAAHHLEKHNWIECDRLSWVQAISLQYPNFAPSIWAETADEVSSVFGAALIIPVYATRLRPARFAS